MNQFSPSSTNICNDAFPVTEENCADPQSVVFLNIAEPFAEPEELMFAFTGSRLNGMILSLEIVDGLETFLHLNVVDDKNIIATSFSLGKDDIPVFHDVFVWPWPLSLPSNSGSPVLDDLNIVDSCTTLIPFGYESKEPLFDDVEELQMFLFDSKYLGNEFFPVPFLSEWQHRLTSPSGTDDSLSALTCSFDEEDAFSDVEIAFPILYHEEKLMRRSSRKRSIHMDEIEDASTNAVDENFVKKQKTFE